MALSEKEFRAIKGLSETEVKERLIRDGYNELLSSKKKGIWRIVFGALKEPMFLLLVACGTVYLILGDITEALMLLGFVFIIMGITIYQEGKTEKAMEALKDLSSPRALVIRDGIKKRIPGKEVVKDDILIIKEGDRIPADAVLLWGMNLSVDESLLTGESVPVRKNPDNRRNLEFCRPGGDDLPFLYSGSLATQGQGMAKVSAVGMNTEIGKIGKVLSSIDAERTALQKEISGLVGTIFVIAVILSLLIVVVYGLTRGKWLDGVLAGITLAMAILPEEFPVVLTVFLALGAWRISKKQVLTRKIGAVEILGSATVLCVDKTGTLTENKMSIKKIYDGTSFHDIWANKNSPLPEKFHHLIEYAILACKKDPFDPMEKALRELGYKTLINTEHLHKNWPLVEEYPLSRNLLALSHVWETPDGQFYTVSAKGAPEAIADLCHLNDVEKEKLAQQVDTLASEGLRVLGVAKTFLKKQLLPESQHDFDFEFIGLIGLADPIRQTVPAAIQECYQAGIRVIMITGDYVSTARNIAEKIGLKNPQEVISGPELEKISPEELAARIKTVNIFARVVPEQKLLIVNALKAAGEIVAMTGDGVNDAPALKSSHIGISMGERGTDVAREASELVLLNDDFSSIIAAVRMGRRIFDNLKKAMAYIISVHIPIAGISLIPVLLGWPIVLYPMHIVFLELIIDPACSIVFESEPEETNIMNRPPHDPHESLFGKRLMTISLLQGIFSLLIVIAVFKSALIFGESEAEARTLTFATLIVSNLCLILTNRSWSRNMISSFSVPNRSLLWVNFGAILFLFLVIYVSAFQKLFHFQWMHHYDLVIALSAGILTVAWFELLKFIYHKKKIEL
ncbi:MAG: cation-translocating P-type ATPase [Elusimicrobiota bacterium]